MAALSTFATTASNVSTDAAKRRITISNEVVEIDGALDDIPEGWEVWMIDGGGWRWLAGSSCTIGNGEFAVLVREFETAHRFGQDNYNGSNGRFVGGEAKFINVDYYTHCRSTGNLSNARSDFDVASGFAGEFQGLRHNALGGYDGSADSIKCFSHFASSSLKLKTHPQLGFSIEMNNEINEAAIEWLREPSTAEGPMLFVDNHPTNTTNAHVAFRLDNVADNSSMTFHGIRARSIATINSSADYSTRGVKIVDPHGDIPRLAWSNEYDGYIELLRTQRFTFTGLSLPANTEIRALAQLANGVDATGSASGAAGSVVVRTKLAANGTGTYATLNSYRFSITGRSFRKYGSPSAVTIGTTPAAIAAALTPDALPDGTALTAYSGADAISTASEFYRVLKDYELAHTAEPSLTESIATINGDGDVVMGLSVAFALSTTASELIENTGGGVLDHYTLKTAAAGLTADKGIGLIDAGNTTNLSATTKGLIKMPVSDQSGTSAQLTITAHQHEFAAVYDATGVYTLGSNSFTADGDWILLIPSTHAAAGVRVGLERPGYEGVSRTIDLSAGGSHSIVFDELVEQLLPDGSAMYSSTASKANISIAASASSGTPSLKVDIANALVSARSIYRAIQDGLSTAAGCKFTAFGGRAPSINIDALNGDALYLGLRSQLRRKAAGNSQAGVLAAVSGGIGGAPVDTANGEVIYKPGTNIQRIQEAIITDFDIDSVTPGTQSLAGTMLSIQQSTAALTPAIARAQHMLRLIVQNLPLHFFAPWQPEIPAAFLLPGQGRLRDVEHRNWGLSSTGDFHIIQGAGIGVLPSAGASVLCSLNRGSGEAVVNYAAECTLACKYRATTLPSTGSLQTLFTLGAMRIYIEPPGADGRAHLRVGSGAAGTSDHYIELNKDFDIIVSIQRQDSRDNYPIVRLSVGPSGDGVAAIQTWNDGSDEIFGSVSSHAGNFTIGGGAIGQLSCCYFHPSNAELSYTWPAGDDINAARWDEDGVDWHGLPSARDEGLATDLIEAQIVEILGKTYSLAEIASAVLSQPLSPGIGPDDDIGGSGQDPGNLTALVKWLTSNVNTTAPASSSTIAAAVRDEAISGAASGSLGEHLASLQNGPTAAQIRDALLTAVIDGTIDFRQAHRLLLAEALGPSSKSGARWQFRRLDADNTLAFSGDADDEGQRSNIEIADE